MLNQKKIYPLSDLLNYHYCYFYGSILPEDFFLNSAYDILPHSIFHFMPFFQKPLYERTLIKFSEKSETIFIEIEFPNKEELEKNFIPLLGDRLGVKDRFGNFSNFSELTYDRLVKEIAVGIDRSIADRKKILSNQIGDDEEYFLGIEEDELNRNYCITGDSDRYSPIWDINDFIKFFYGRSKGLNLQNLEPPKNYQLPLGIHHGYTKFIKNHYGSNKFVIKLKGFSQKELSYLKRFFSFDLNKSVRKKNFKFDSSKIEINYHQHEFFMGEHEHNDPTHEVDFIEKLMWWFDFENKSFDRNTTVTVRGLENCGSLYFFPDYKLIQVNDLSKGKYIPPPKDLIFDDQDILGQDIKLEHLEELTKSGILGNYIYQDGYDFDVIKDCFEAVYFYDWNIGVGFHDVLRDKIFEQIKTRMKDARSSLRKEYLSQIENFPLNYKDLKSNILKSESFKNTNKFLKICAEFFLKHNICPKVYILKDTETEVLSLKQLINNSEFLRLNKLPTKLKTQINKKDELIELNDSFIDIRMDFYLQGGALEDLELHFWCDSSKTRDSFLEMVGSEFTFNFIHQGYDDPEKRFVLKIEKWDLFRVWTYLSLLEEIRLEETFEKYISITKKPISFQLWKKTNKQIKDGQPKFHD